MTVAETKQDRLYLRLDSTTKRKLERAATYLRASTSEFVLTNAVAAAEKVLEEQRRITLSETDWDCFMDALECPAEPNPRLLAALRSHTESVVQK